MNTVPLFQGITIRDQVIRNRVWVPAMCQYSAPDGCPTDWHFSHYSGLATSAGCVIVEATAVSQIARVTPQDLVLSAGSLCLEKYAALARRILQRGALPGIQLSHAGRKGSRTRPWEGDAALKPTEGGWQTISPSPLAFGAGYEAPVEMDEVVIEQAIDEFVSSARLAYEAGFKLVEIHGGHGRLVHSFLSPVSNRRVDRYGGNLENRARFACEIARRVRAAIGEESILAFRLSCVDWCEGGLTIADSVQVARWLKDAGVDLIDCSSGGIVRPLAKRTSPGYQVPFATEIRRGAGIATAAVGLIGSLDHAEEILEKGEADVVLLGRLLMMDPLALTRTALECGLMDAVPPQYRRGLRDASRVAAEHIPEL